MGEPLHILLKTHPSRARLIDVGKIGLQIYGERPAQADAFHRKTGGEFVLLLFRFCVKGVNSVIRPSCRDLTNPRISIPPKERGEIRINDRVEMSHLLSCDQGEVVCLLALFHGPEYEPQKQEGLAA